MNRNTVIFAVVALVILAILGGYLVARNNQVSVPATTTTTPNPSMSTAPPSNTHQGTTVTQTLNIQNMTFTPASITVKKGTSVTWTNNDVVAHTVVEADGQTGPDSATVPPKGTYTFTYNTVGTFHYHCSIHPNMTGTVVVTD